VQARGLEVRDGGGGGVVFLDEDVGDHRMHVGVVGKKLGDAAVLFQSPVPGPGLGVIVGALEELAFIVSWHLAPNQGVKF